MQDNCDNSYYPLNEKYLMMTLVFVISFISVGTYVFLVADSIKEYMNSFYLLIVTCAVFISYTTTILNAKKLFCFYDDCEKFHDDGK